LFFCIFSFGHCAVCSSSICGFWLPIWYLQTLPTPSFQWRLRDSRISFLFNALLICVCTFVLFLLNIVLSVDFRLMIHQVVSTNMFSYAYLLQCCVIYLWFFYFFKNKCERYYRKFDLDISDDFQFHCTYFASDDFNISAHSSGL
jgi:amino acid permease